MTDAKNRECIKRWYENHPLYPSFQAMLRNCGYRPGASSRIKALYAGIRVCDEWKNYPTFESWAVAHGWSKGLRIVRIDKTKDFCPENCVIVPYGEAVNMRRNTFRVDGVPLRTLIGGTPRRGDKMYVRIRNRIDKCRFDIESAISVPTLTPSQCQVLSTRARESSFN